MRNDPASFVLQIWNHVCTKDQKVFLSTKSLDGHWEDHKFLFNDHLESKLKIWFKKYSPKKYDLYFCPLPYSSNRRDKNKVEPLNILWSDIDDGSISKVPPSILWKSSNKRYQGIWLLDKKYNPLDVEETNQDLAYYLGADKGGWDLTQVLRIPGTLNHKYDPPNRVRKYKTTGEVFKLRKITKKVSKGRKKTNKEEVNISSKDELGKLIVKYKSKISRKTIRLLMQERVEAGKRSDMLWFMENQLSDAGIPPDDIINLIKYSKWNKYKGRGDEDVRLKSEMSKIVSNKLEEDEVEQSDEVEEDNTASFIIETYSGLLSSLDTYPGWLIEGFWLKNSHGIVAGESKAFKSTLILDMAMSIASGRNFLGKFPVNNQGTVLYIQNENAKWIMKDRMEKIAYSKGLVGKVINRKKGIRVKFAEDIPLHFINTQSYLLNDPIHQKLTLEIMKQYKPNLIIFDPLYLMYDGDLGSAQDLNPILNWLLMLKEEFRCAVILVHHWNKSGQSDRGGQKMLGSVTLHGWIESAWYLETNGSKEVDSGEINDAKASSQIVIEREFRGAGVHPKVSLNLSMGEFGSNHYKVETEVYHKDKPSRKDLGDDEMDELILGVLNVQVDAISLRQVSRDTGLSRDAVRKSVDRLCMKELTALKRGKVIINRGE